MLRLALLQAVRRRPAFLVSTAANPSQFTTTPPPRQLSSLAMKAVTFQQPGGLEVLQYVDVERPTPAEVR